MEVQNQLFTEESIPEVSSIPIQKAVKQEVQKVPVKPITTKPTLVAEKYKKKEELKLVEALDFNMKVIEGGSYALNDKVSIEVSSYEMSQYEVTQEQWRSVMGSNPSYFKGCDNCPVEQVSWNDVQRFIKKLNQREHANYRLPTHPEWYYAVRGGNKREGFVYYQKKEVIKEIAWCDQNAENKTHEVGVKEANELGLNDMTGNVWEWIANVWPDDYDNGISSSHERAEDKSDKMLLGGGWSTSTQNFFMIWYMPQFAEPDFKRYNLGFRLAK